MTTHYDLRIVETHTKKASTIHHALIAHINYRIKKQVQ